MDSQNYLYNTAGQRTSETNTAGDYRNYSYDNDGEIKTAAGKESGGASRLQEQFGYAYDAAGNLNFKTNNALIQTFSVNDLNELTADTNSGTLTVAGTTTIPATSVTVDGLTANRYADATFALGGFTPTNGLNAYTAIGEDASGNWSTNTSTVNVILTNSAYAYDSNGNMTCDGYKNFAYDDENELTAVWVSDAWSNSFAYDGKMRRRIERDYSWDAGTSGWQETNEVHFIYDGNVVVEERNAGNVPQVSYTRGNDLSGTMQGAGGIGGLLARTTHGQELPGAPPPAFYHADGNGNITALIYPNQQLAAKYLYDPFGSTLAMSGPLMNLNKYRFSSKEWCDNSGLYYYLYRFYDPCLQRWPNRDPMGEPGWTILHNQRFSASDGSLNTKIWHIRDFLMQHGLDPLRLTHLDLLGDGSDKYNFVMNDPLLYVDSDGRRCIWAVLGCASLMIATPVTCSPVDAGSLCWANLVGDIGACGDAADECDPCYSSSPGPHRPTRRRYGSNQWAD